MKTCKVELKTESVFRFLNVLDENESSYHFTRIPDASRKPNVLIELELWADGSPDPMRITLHPDGTWSASSCLIVGKED